MDRAKNDSVYQEWERRAIAPGWYDHLKSAFNNDEDDAFNKSTDATSPSIENHMFHKNLFFPDGSLNVLQVLRQYLENNRVDRLLSNKDLLKELERHEDPFTPNWGTRNPSTFVFSSYLWNFVLKTQFSTSSRPTLKMRNLRNSFIDEMIPYVSSGLDLPLLTRFSKRIEEHGFQYAPTDNYYEIPAIFRILTPPYAYFVPRVFCQRRHYYMRRCLEGLPHGVLMYPFERFQLTDIVVFKNAKLVSCVLSYELLPFPF